MPTTRPEAGDFAPFYENYVALVPVGHDPLTALRSQTAEVQATFGALTEAQALTAYAPGKWTPKQVLLHLADAERVFTYRALRFARADNQELAGFDENAYADTSDANARSMSDLLAEYTATRAATLALFEGFTEVQLDRRGTANGAAVTVRALLFILPGHERHHLHVFHERYAPVLHS
ncbi:DNA damage-inducible protein DinB [Hymenobacter coccineus]|uniref:DNA damage-inducible protein DinB n=2 Tax=Hymenobacter coccineus TaxID=1908235 RepID=A0A1G1TJ60_9BACT|nr:DNA damage-inducible protein DinB [Hymenobacter coccineus]